MSSSMVSGVSSDMRTAVDDAPMEAEGAKAAAEPEIAARMPGFIIVHCMFE